jgi:hypothetical protein
MQKRVMTAKIDSIYKIPDENHHTKRGIRLSEGGLRKPITYVVSLRDETGKYSYYNESNANIRMIADGDETHVHIDTPMNQDKIKATKEEVAKDDNDYLKNEEEAKDQDQFCPSIIRKKVGLFEETSSSPVKDEFEDTILLVSSNYAYYNMLQNWEFLANEQHLKWVVLALDEKLYDELGPDRAIPPGNGYSVSGAYGWRQGNFQKLSCNKMRMALEIANNCKVNVVFTDVDNIFLQNPFEHDFGRLIQSKRYDYLYQPNEPVKEARENWCMQGKPRREANTGFYYIRHGNEIYKRITEATLDRCQDPENTIDDQTLFWKEFWKVKKDLEGFYDEERRNKGEITTFHHCGFQEYENPELMLPNENKEESNVGFHWCCIDPYYYPIGKHDDRFGPSNRDPVTYHANHASTYDKKVQKLLNVRSDGHGWDTSRFKDGIGGVLVD